MRIALFFLAVVLAVFFAVPAHAELVAYWDFETTLDDAENGFDGTYRDGASGTPASSPNYSIDTPSALSHSSNSLDFGSTNSSLNVLVSPTGGGLFTGMQNQGTIVAWFKTTASPSGFHYIFANQNNGSGNRLYLHTNGSTFGGSMDNPYQSFGYRSFDPTAWHHGALVWRKDGTTNLYLDAVADTEGDTYTPFNGGTVDYNTRIGNLGNGAGGGQYWQGLVDDIAVFKDALTQAQIQSLVDGTRTPFSVTPEPGCWTLLAMGALALLAWRRRR